MVEAEFADPFNTDEVRNALLQYHNVKFVLPEKFEPPLFFIKGYRQHGTALTAKGSFSILKSQCCMHKKQLPFFIFGKL